MPEYDRVLMLGLGRISASISSNFVVLLTSSVKRIAQLAEKGIRPLSTAFINQILGCTNSWPAELEDGAQNLLTYTLGGLFGILFQPTVCARERRMFELW
jgi:hypothetical protein